jgi:hypothetical protein
MAVLGCAGELWRCVDFMLGWMRWECGLIGVVAALRDSENGGDGGIWGVAWKERLARVVG